MTSIFQKLKLPLIIIAVLFAGYIVYNSFVKDAPNASLLQKTSLTSSSTSQSSPEQKLIPLLLKIQSVTLDEKLFLDPVFRALVDFSQPIVPENIGKPNPFSGALSGAVNSSLESLGFVDGSTTTVIVPKAPVKKVAPKTTIKK